MSLDTARKTAASVQARLISAQEVAAQAARRIAASKLNAVVNFDALEGAAHAADVDRCLAAGETLPLAGVPVLVKDNIWVRDRRVTQGSLLFKDYAPQQDAIVVERLRHAGAVIMGMTNTPEFACKGLTNNKIHGPTLHPQDPGLTPGGSSGGAVAAIAAGLTPLAIGTDAGGSSRRPAAHVGVVGFKPSFGALPYGPGFAEPFAGLSCICPIAGDVADAACLFEALAGPHLADPDTIPIANHDPDDARLCVAFSPLFGLDALVDDEVAETMERVVEALASAGVRVLRRDPVWPEGATEPALMPLQHAGLAAIHGASWRANPDLFDPDVGAQIESGLGLDGVDVMRARLMSVEVARSIARLFSQINILIGPTIPCAAWPWNRLGPELIGGAPASPRAHAVFTPLFNHAMTPALSLPCGRTSKGLPLGLQIIAARGRDRRVLAAAARFETILDQSGLWKGLSLHSA